MSLLKLLSPSLTLRCLNAQVAIIVASVVIWFVSFPDDLAAITTPLRLLLSLASEILALTNSVSPYAYGLASVAVICLYWRPDRSKHAEN